MTDRYLVLGNPIEHSLSPDIHRMFAEQTGEDIDYERRLVDTADGAFQTAIRTIIEEGYSGVNVTVPFKETAFSVADELSERVRKAGASNTLVIREDGGIYADNTDGAGLVRDIRDNLGRPISGKRILVIGAGGAVRGVLKPLIDEKPATITLTNRTMSKAEQLIELFADEFSCDACPAGMLESRQFDIIINGTSLGLQGKVAELPGKLFASNSLAYDMMYGAGSMPFQEWALQQGASTTTDGLGMLVGQAAESFYVWRNVRPEVAPVIEQLRSR